MRTNLLLAVAVMIAVPFSPAAGREIYVNNLAGDDTFTGDQPRTTVDRGGPVRSITKALRLADRGDRIVVANTGEPYRESISLVGSRHSGFSFKPLVIEGNGAILDGSAPVPASSWENYQGPVFRFRPARLEHQQLFLDDRPATQVVVSHLAGGPPELEPLEWCLSGGHIYFCVEWTRLPEDYALTYTGQQVGITLFHVEHVVIVDLTVQGFQLDGINAHNSARQIAIDGVTCRGNGRAGIVVGGASLVDIGNSLIGDNGQAQLLTQKWSQTHVHDSELLPNTAPAVVNRGGRVYIDGQPLEAGATGR